MKNWLLKLSILLLTFYGEVSAQTVSVPDTNLLNFLRTSYPTTFDANKKLLIAEAAKVKGAITLHNGNIANLDGIEYFTSIKSLDFGLNAISKIPTLKNDSLKILLLNGNQLAVLPSLDGIPNLKELDVANNKLVELPSLNKLVLLQKVICMGNQLVSFPSLDSLKSLVALDISFNKLTEIPKTPKNNVIQTFNLNNNLIDKLPDSFVFPSLKKLFLYDNNLTFKELLKIISVPNYSSLFSIFSQNKLRVGKKIWIKENESFSLWTGVDAGVNDITYDWQLPNGKTSTSSKDQFRIGTASLSDSGFYTCQISHTSFPNLILYTDSFYVKVIPCPNPSAFSTTSSSISCNKSGSLSIKNLQNQSVSYILKNDISGASSTSSNGFFAGLSEPKYWLSFKNTTGCETAPIEIFIPKDECRQVLITPNGDGESDTYFFTQTGKVTIYDKRNSIIKTFSIPSEWDGSGKNGKVSPGYYIADINNGEEAMTISVVY